MIFMRSGKTGTGKSNDAVWLCHYFWKRGLDIASNTPLFFTNFNNGFGGQNIIDNPDEFSYFERFVNWLNFKYCLYFNKEYIPKRRGIISYFDTLEETFYLKNTAILFDEGQTAFRNYDWEAVPRLFLYKLEQNRKHGLHLITTAQRVKAVNINYRELIQDWAHFETILDIFGFHFYRKKIKDVDYITENMQEQDIPDMKVYRFKYLAPWSKRIYDTMYDIGFEPLQEYSVMINNQQVNLILESGMTVKQAITNINSYEKLLKYV